MSGHGAPPSGGGSNPAGWVLGCLVFIGACVFGAWWFIHGLDTTHYAHIEKGYIWHYGLGLVCIIASIFGVVAMFIGLKGR